MSPWRTSRLCAPRSLSSIKAIPRETPQMSELSDATHVACASVSRGFPAIICGCVLCPSCELPRMWPCSGPNSRSFRVHHQILPTAGGQCCPRRDGRLTLLLPSWLKGSRQALHSGASVKDKPHTKLPLFFFSVSTQNLAAGSLPGLSPPLLRLQSSFLGK